MTQDWQLYNLCSISCGWLPWLIKANGYGAHFRWGWSMEPVDTGKVEMTTFQSWKGFILQCRKWTWRCQVTCQGHTVGGELVGHFSFFLLRIESLIFVTVEKKHYFQSLIKCKINLKIFKSGFIYLCFMYNLHSHRSRGLFWESVENLRKTGKWSDLYFRKLII